MDNIHVYNIRYMCVCVYIYYGSIKYLMRQRTEGSFYKQTC